MIDKGEIAEQGTHAELVARGGIYAKLVARQLARQQNSLEQGGDQKQNSNIDVVDKLLDA